MTTKTKKDICLQCTTGWPLVRKKACKNRRDPVICGGVIVRILTGNYNDLTTVLRQPVEVFACPFALLIDDIADGK